VVNNWRYILSWQVVNENTIAFIKNLPEGDGYKYSVRFRDTSDYPYSPEVDSKEDIINKIKEVGLDKQLKEIIIYPDGSYLGRHWAYSYK
jgi:hypothetical protein